MSKSLVVLLTVAWGCAGSFGLRPAIEAAPQDRPSPNAASNLRTEDIEFKSDEGYLFDGRIVLPPAEQRNGFGILLMGGGIGNDLNWSVPGVLEHGGVTRQVTINGKPHSDAPRLANYLAQCGYVVMHWSTIRRNDPKRDRWPIEATIYSAEARLQHARAALRAFRATGKFNSDKTILLGHSLGAARAVNLAADDDRVAGLILLGAAKLTRTAADDRGSNRNKGSATAWLKKVDVDQDGKCGVREYRDWRKSLVETDRPLADQSFSKLDFDCDKHLSLWEICAGIARAKRLEMNFGELESRDRSGLLWSEDVLLGKPEVPCYVLYGSLDDAQAHHAPVLSDLVNSRKLPCLTVEVILGVGHQMGREQIGAWLSLVERCVRDAEVAGSNPVAPISRQIRIEGKSVQISSPDNRKMVP